MQVRINDIIMVYSVYFYNNNYLIYIGIYQKIPNNEMIGSQMGLNTENSEHFT